ncbi:MAG TPA: ATP-binding protein [Chitinophagaceae bacterium]
MAQKTVAIDAMDEWKEELANWKLSKPSSVSRIYYPKEVVPQIWNLFGDLFNQLPDDARIYPADFENGLYCIQGNTGFGYIGFNHIREASEEEKEIIQRFAIEFGRVYQRFLDLQKAEAQAREAQIETGLEKVRSKTMAMHKSEEVTAIAVTLNGELLKLGFGGGSTIIIIDKETGDTEQWTGFSEDQALRSCYVPHFNHPYHDALLSAWKADEKFLVYTVAGPDKKKLDEHYFATGYKIFPDNDKKWMRDMESVTFSHAFMKYGAIHWGPDHLTDEQLKILQRFSKVFEQSYTRFLDLKKAEAQAREAEIELALERVRARTMAMQKSEELQEVVHTVFERLKELNIDFYTAIIILFEEGSKDIVWWLESKAKQQYQKTLVPYAEFSYLQDLLKARENNIDFFSKSYPFEEKNKLFHHLFTHTELKYVPQQQKEFLFGAEFATMSVSLSKNTGLHITSYSRKSFSDQDNDVFRRFAKVFDQAYTRFQDLQKAEAQARESLIELGLERVRARAMAMQNSDELGELVAILFDELTKLDLILARCIIWIFDSVSFEARMWMANSEDKRIAKSYFIKRIHHPYYDAILSGWKERKIKWVYDLKGDDKKTIDQILLNETELSQLSEAVKKGILSSEETFVAGSFNNFGLIEASGPAQPTDEQLDILNRFGKVFDLSYTRFNDLKQAEAQAREAKIETALEKVRASTMAMQKSEDLSKTAFVLFNQFKELGEAPERIFIATFDDHDNGVVDLWGTDQGGNQLNKLFKLPVNEPTMVSKIIAGWKEKRRSVVVDLKGEELRTYLRFIKQAGIPVTEGVMTERRVQTAACFSNGVIGVTTPEPQSAEAVQLQERFAGVFDLAYTRFLDLQKAEAQAHEAKIETALERVRARALAMQEPEELKEVAQVLRTEMGLLGIEELETCSIYIHEKDSETAECWYALKDPKETEKKMVADHFHLQLTETWVGREMKKFYSSDEKQTSIVMQGTNRKEWIAYCYKHSPVFAGFYGETIPNRTYHLYKFSHGYIGAAAPGDISAESWRLLSRAASVFSLAYSRFRDLTQARNDLIKLKEEKKRAEVALTELQATQKQLIQSEKMASLGELTAGIAHEIQNPLNFVNNFSDVSNELIEELKIKNEKLKIEDADVKDLLNDIAQNLEKINHHGKRADAIVKGMLQHSRSSSGQKEPTDINTLAEEYLRLAYHGLRAKDKFFNAKFETEFDPSIDKIKIVPQEIGRVILNLINNSFYAVSEKKKNTANGYEPSVTVSTKKIKDTVEIRIKDNGSGIPQKVLDKIFQPFFTTKPTGQGTGLGLSLAYDIVTKGHDGEIKVETEEGEGSEFTITLPMN